MTPDLFLFSLAGDPKPFERFAEAQRRTNAARSGKKYVLVRGDALEFVADLTVAFPQPNSVGLDYTDWLDFINANKAREFLYMPITGPALHRENKTYTTDGIITVFAFEHLWIDSSSVRVFLDTGGGEVEISPASYTFSGNGVAPIVTFSVAPAAGTLRIQSNFFVPVFFRSSPTENGEGLADPRMMEVDAPRSFEVNLVETEPGARFVNATEATTSA